MRELSIESAQEGLRLDKYLQKYMPKAPKSFFYKMLRKKNITRNGKKCDGSERLAEGDVIRLFLSEETIEGFRREAAAFSWPSTSLDFVWEDGRAAIINKPAGMLSQKAKAEDVSLVEYLIGSLLERGELTKEELRSFRPSVCNRLDRNTTGLVIFGKNSPALRELNAMIRDRDALEKLPKVSEPLRLEDGNAYLIKTDILKGIMWFSYDASSTSNLIPVSKENVFKILEINRRGKAARSLVDTGSQKEKTHDFLSAVDEESIFRFDESKRSRKGRKRGR